MDLLLAGGALLALCLGATVPLHDFADPTIWKPNADGGQAPQVSAAKGPGGPGPAMRLQYTDSTAHWGNLTGPCRVPADAVALRFRLEKRRSAPNAAMHVWLMEPDGDAWLAAVRVDGKGVGDLKPGWHEVRLPVGAFSFQPRGKNTREMPGASRMLLGCNFGDLDVVVADMVWETAGTIARQPLPRTANLALPPAGRGRVGVLTMPGVLPDGFHSGHSPEALAAALTAAGYGAVLLQAGDLANAAVLTAANFDLVVLPYGPFFPEEARATFTAWLRAGGSFLSTDGYAFERLVVWSGTTWTTVEAALTAAQTAAPPAALAPMNTRSGKPGDAMTFTSDQIGVFDPHFALADAAQYQLSAWPGVAEVGLAPVRPAEPLAGWSASGLIGVNSPVFPDVYRRWQPVLEVFDTEGGARGTALSLMHNFSGRYRGSSWAFSGLTSGQDLFCGGAAQQRLLATVADHLVQRVYLHSPASGLACYRLGETAVVQVTVSNHGKAPVTAQVTLGQDGQPADAPTAVTLAPGASEVVERRWPVTTAMDDLVRFTAELRVGEHYRDRLSSAFAVWSPAVIAQGPKIAWSGNYLTIDGRPAFLAGSNQTGMMYYSPHENPDTWDRDFALMAAHNLHLLRILHFSPFAKDGYQGKGAHSSLDLKQRPERLCRQMDAIVQLAQKHRVAIFLALHDWLPVSLTDAELAAQADWCQFWAARYRDVPGIFYDVQNEPSVDTPERADIVELWNRWLAERYGTMDALRAAWRRTPPTADLPRIPFKPGSNEWDDVHTADYKRFQAELLNRWLKANVAGIKAGAPQAPTCVGYLPSMPPADKILGVRHTDFSNMHYYGPVEQFPLEIKLTDRRFCGKGFSVGEFGAQEDHDDRSGGGFDPHEVASVQRFGRMFRYAFGLGAAFMANWSLKEYDEMVFPWGLLHHGTPVAKPWANTYSQSALYVAGCRPVYEEPAVWLLAPDRHRVGPHFDTLHHACQRAASLLLDQRVNFGVLNEEDLVNWPAAAQVAYWPLPYCPSDETFAKVLAWVKAGGTLYLSGDIQYDPARQPTRGERRGALGLPPAEPENPFAVPEGAWSRAMVETTVGKGHVIYAPYPLELRDQPGNGAVYARALDVAKVPRLDVTPGDAPVRVLQTATADGGRVVTVLRSGTGEAPLAITVAGGAATIELRQAGAAMVTLDRSGAVVAAESEGRLTIGGAELATADGHFALVALDGRDLRQSTQVLLLPHQNRQVRLTGRLATLSAWTAASGAAEGQTRQPAATVPFGRGQLGVLASPADLAAARQALRQRQALR